MTCKNNVYCIITKFLCGQLNKADFLDELAQNEDPDALQLHSSLKKKGSVTKIIYNFLVEKKMFPKYLSPFNIGLKEKRNTTISALFALKEADKDKNRPYFLQIITSNIDKFASCGAICKYLNSHEYCYYNRERFKEFLNNNPHCLFIDDYSYNLKSLTDKEIDSRDIKPGYKTLLKYGNEILTEKKKVEKQLLTKNKTNLPKIKKTKNLLYVLRRFNSFSPIINGNSRVGGGYLFWTGKEGIAIDPGIDFIKNYLDARFPISLITKIIITHAHPDHTADVPNLLTLHYENNELLTSEKKQKYSSIHEDIYHYNLENNSRKLDIYLNLSSYEYLSGFINLDSKKVNYNIHILDSGSIFNISNELELISLPTIHRDCITSNSGVGIVLRSKKNKFQIVYTSDTSINAELLNRYKKILSGNKIKTSLLANIGGVHINELNSLFYLNEINKTNEIVPSEFRYPNHLGIIGLFDLIRTIKPDSLLLGEIGIEMDSFKHELAKNISNEAKIPCVIADLGLTYNPQKDSCYINTNEGIMDANLKNVQGILNNVGQTIYVSLDDDEAILNSTQFIDNYQAWIYNLPTF